MQLTDAAIVLEEQLGETIGVGKFRNGQRERSKDFIFVQKCPQFGLTNTVNIDN